MCEGSVTEPDYFEGFSVAYKNPRVRVKVMGGVGVPQTIVEAAREHKREAEKRARREKDENLCFDEVWCVFDVDDPTACPKL